MLDLQPIHIDISPLLATIGVYNLVSGEQAGNRPMIEAVFAGLTIYHPPLLLLAKEWRCSTISRLISGYAWFAGCSGDLRTHPCICDHKVRQRMVTLYFHAMLKIV
jgi:hypothetical protein